MKLCYIGCKPLKIDKTSGSRLVFPRFEPIEVEKEFALRLLRHPDVYVEEKGLEDAKAKIAEKEAKRLAKEAAAKLDKKEELEANSRTINIGGIDVDLRKYTHIKLKTLVESFDLDVTPKQAAEKVTAYCDRVYDAYQKLGK